MVPLSESASAARLDMREREAPSSSNTLRTTAFLVLGLISRRTAKRTETKGCCLSSPLAAPEAALNTASEVEEGAPLLARARNWCVVPTLPLPLKGALLTLTLPLGVPLASLEVAISPPPNFATPKNVF